MKLFFQLILAIGILMVLDSSRQVAAQSCVSGRVLGVTDHKPLGEVNISAGKGKGTTSGLNGEFRLCMLSGDSVTLTLSYLGYETATVRCKPGPEENRLPDIFLYPAALSVDEVVVTATRTDNNILNTPVRVNLITPLQLKSIPMQTIDEVLRFSPGINYSRPFGIFSTKAIVMLRGLSGKEQGRVLVLEDGVPLNKSDGGTVDWNMIDVNSVEKIEISKGAGSAVYGGNAMGGIINIITGRPQEPFYFRAAAEYGTYNTLGGKLGAGGIKPLKNGAGSFFWRLNSFYRQSDGYITQSEADIRSNPYIVKSDMQEAGASLKTGIDLAKNQTLEASLNYYNDRRGTGEKVYQPEGNTTDHDSYGITLNYKARFGSLSLNSSIFNLEEDYKKVNEYMKDDYTWYLVLSTRRDYGWLTSVSKPLGKDQVITAGFDFKNGSVDAYDKYLTSTDIVYNKGTMTSSALFAQDELSLAGKRLRIVAGLRFDLARFYKGSFRIQDPSAETEFMFGYQVPEMPEQHWSALSPRLSAQYRWRRGDRWYASYSKGFRASVLDDLCRSGRIKGGFKLANPAVKPEYLSNYETGIDLQPFRNSVFSTSLFYSRGKDFQYYVSNGQTIDMGFGERPVFIRANISQVEIWGAETELRVEPGHGLTLFANYSYTHSQILKYQRISGNDTIDLAGKFLTDVPQHIVSAGVNWNNRFVNAGMYLHYTGPEYINDQNTRDEILLSDQYPAYTTFDLRLWKSFKKQYKISLNVQNLFDVKYYDSKYAVCPGRFITAEFSFTL